MIRFGLMELKCLEDAKVTGFTIICGEIINRVLIIRFDTVKLSPQFIVRLVTVSPLVEANSNSLSL